MILYADDVVTSVCAARQSASRDRSADQTPSSVRLQEPTDRTS